MRDAPNYATTDLTTKDRSGMLNRGALFLAIMLGTCASSMAASRHHANPMPTLQLPPGVAPQTEAWVLADMLGQGKISPDLVLAMDAQRIRAHDDALHTIIALNPGAEADAQAASTIGPLHGLPILVKDNIETADLLPTTAGSLALTGNLTHRDAFLITQLRRAGGVVLGKTNLSEWANFRSTHSTSGWSATGGLTRNPWDTSRTPCGSSAGSAAAVAAGFAAAAIGTETDGSITCPAAMNGIVGFKPTLGLVSRTGVVPISPMQDTAGPMARSVRDVALLLGALAGHDPADPATRAANMHRTDFVKALDPHALSGQRIGVLRFAQGTSPAMRAVFEQALQVLRAQGAILVDIAQFDPHSLSADEHQALLCEFHAAIDHYLGQTPQTVTTRSLTALIAFNTAHSDHEMRWFDQDLLERAAATAPPSDPACQAARARARNMAGPNGIDAMLAHDHLSALVAPTIGPAFTTDLINGDRPDDGTGAGQLAAIAGYPHLTVPMGQVEGMPVGLSLIGAAGSDAQILADGYSYEQARGAWVPPPHYQ